MYEFREAPSDSRGFRSSNPGHLKEYKFPFVLRRFHTKMSDAGCPTSPKLTVRLRAIVIFSNSFSSTYKMTAAVRPHR